MNVGDRREWQRLLQAEEATEEERAIAQARLAASDAAIAAHSATAEETAEVDALSAISGDSEPE